MQHPKQGFRYTPRKTTTAIRPAEANDAGLILRIIRSQRASIERAPSSPEELQQTIARDIKLHAELVKAAGLVSQ